MKPSINMKYPTLIFIILLLGMLAPAAIDEYAPSMPHMARYFATSLANIQFTITIMLLFLGIGQVIMGPLSDHYGRKKIVMVGLLIFLIGTLICIFAPNVGILLLGRGIQGFGVASAAMTCSALIGECFTEEEIPIITGYFILTYGLVPIIAPIAGGYIQEYLGWQANFWLMFILIAAAWLIVIAFLQETVKTFKKPNLKSLFKGYKVVLSNKRYMMAVTGGFFSWSMIITFSIVAPFLIQNTLKYSATVYGYTAFAVGLGFFIGTILNPKLLKKFSVDQLIIFGGLLALLPSIILLALTFLGIYNIWIFIIPTFIAMIGIGFTFPNYYGKAVAVFTEEHTGVANALIGALILFGTVIYSIFLTRLNPHEVTTLGIVYTILVIGNLVTAQCCRKNASSIVKMS